MRRAWILCACLTLDFAACSDAANSVAATGGRAVADAGGPAASDDAGRSDIAAPDGTFGSADAVGHPEDDAQMDIVADATESEPKADVQATLDAATEDHAADPGDSQVDSELESGVDAGTEAMACACSSGQCCDGCRFRPWSYVCGEAIYETRCRVTATCRALEEGYRAIACNGDAAECTRWGGSTFKWVSHGCGTC